MTLIPQLQQSIANNPRSQNYSVHNVISFCDNQYLTDTNLSTMVNKGKKVPQYCSKCKRTICNHKTLNCVIRLYFKKLVFFCLCKNMIFSP